MLFARIGQFAANIARHAVPVGGIFGSAWHPVTAITVYWLESVLMALSAAFLCLLLQRRVSPAAITAASREGGRALADAVEAQRAEIAKANIAPRDVFGFHIGSMMVFGIFLAGVIFMLSANGQIAEPIRWHEMKEGAFAIFVVVALTFLFDTWSFHRMSVASVQARVDGCLTRWGLFWLLGFVGLIIIGVTGRATAFFSFFAGLKVTIETYSRLARLLGWTSTAQQRGVYESSKAS